MRSFITMQLTSSSVISMPMEVWVNLETASSIPPLRALPDFTTISLWPAMYAPMSILYRASASCTESASISDR